ncbi:MAG: polysaccharide deacetylase family protein [Flavobacteriaceae bacterium]|nr:polysaccharide deacetylase family protein [Flavobacteriaceae bacterium]
MKPYFVKTPSLVPVLYQHQIWNFSSKQKNIYLTFDDGPTPKITDWVLDTLQQYKASATFFCIGENIEAHPTFFKRIINNGHSIGNHTYNHLNGWKTSTKDYVSSILKTEEIIQNLKPETSNLKPHPDSYRDSNFLFRPPYGKIKSSQTKSLQKLGYKIIMWSVLSADFDITIDAEKCLDNVIKNTQNGSVIVFHDSEKAFEKLKVVLPKVLVHFSKKGYSFKRIK